MKRKIKFKDDIPKFVWLGARGFPKDSDKIQYSDGSFIHVSTAPNYRAALERIYTSSMYMEPKDAEKFMSGLVQYLDDQDEDIFYLMLMEFKEWHKHIDMDNKK